MKNFGLITLMRPKQWIKNAFVLAPVIFSGKFMSLDLMMLAILAALAFCCASSATYILNDYRDIESDKKHPVKSRTRPLAAGVVSKRQAILLIVLLYALLIVYSCYYLEVALVIVSYLILNVAYTLYLKHAPVLDVFTIATGFVLRVYAGTVAISVPLSSWMLITTFSLALFLASVKRRQELLKNGSKSRNVLSFYTKELIDKFSEMSATCAIVFYSLFVMSENQELVITIPFVLFGLYRYWYVVEVIEQGESPTDALYSDKVLQVNILSWVCISAYIILLN